MFAAGSTICEFRMYQSPTFSTVVFSAQELHCWVPSATPRMIGRLLWAKHFENVMLIFAVVLFWWHELGGVLLLVVLRAVLFLLLAYFWFRALILFSMKQIFLDYCRSPWTFFSCQLVRRQHKQLGISHPTITRWTRRPSLPSAAPHNQGPLSYLSTQGRVLPLMLSSFIGPFRG